MASKELSVEVIKEELKFAASVMRRLPPVRAQGYFSVWPDIIRDRYELLVGDIKPKIDRPMPEDVSRMDEILEWLKVLTLEEKRLVWKRANKVPWKILEHEFSLHRSNLSARLKIAYVKIQSYLR